MAFNVQPITVFNSTLTATQLECAVRKYLKINSTVDPSPGDYPRSHNVNDNPRSNHTSSNSHSRSQPGRANGSNTRLPPTRDKATRISSKYKSPAASELSILPSRTSRHSHHFCSERFEIGTSCSLEQSHTSDSVESYAYEQMASNQPTISFISLDNPSG